MTTISLGPFCLQFMTVFDLSFISMTIDSGLFKVLLIFSNCVDPKLI